MSLRHRPRSARARIAALGALVVLATACSSDAPTAPSDTQPLDVGALLAETTLPAVAGAATPLSLVSPVPVPRLAASATSCSYDPASRSFVCPSSTTNGVTVAMAYTVYDAAGTPQARADRSTTASLRVVTTAAGTVTLPGAGGAAANGASGTVTITQRRDLTLGGLLTGTHHTLDGGATSTLEGALAVAGTPAPIGVTLTETIAGVVLPARSPGAPQWPSAGTITVVSTTALGASGGATTLHTQMAFNGTSTVTLTITGSGATQRCTVDLAAQAPPACQ